MKSKNSKRDRPSRSQGSFPTLCLSVANWGQGEGKGASAGDDPTEKIIQVQLHNFGFSLRTLVQETDY